MARRPSEQLRQWLLEQVPRMEPGARLADDACLAKRWGVSVRTVKKILRELGERGLVWRIQGKGTFVPSRQSPAEPAPPAAGPLRSSVDSLVESVYDAIATGELQVGDALPSVKFMSLRFRVSTRTVMRAYAVLRERGLTQRIGKTFWVGRLTEIVRAKPRKEVYLLRDPVHRLTQIFRNDLLSSAYCRMEEELTGRGMVLRFESTNRLEALFADWDRSGCQPAGMLFFNMDDTLFAKPLRLLQARFRGPGAAPMRVVVDWRQGSLDMRQRWMNVVSRGNLLTVFARALSRAVANRGGEVCFVFDEDKALWNAYAFLFPLVRLRTEIRHVYPDMRYRFFVVSSSRRVLTERLRGFSSLVQGQLSKYEPTPLSVLHDEVSIVDGFAQAYHGRSSAAVWVFSSDRRAAEAIRFLHEQGRAVPGEVSIIGLENDPAFYHLGISYCGPDWGRLGYLMAHTLIGDIPVAHTRKGFVRTGALFRERLTTAPRSR